MEIGRTRDYLAIADSRRENRPGLAVSVYPESAGRIGTRRRIARERPLRNVPAAELRGGGAHATDGGRFEILSRHRDGRPASGNIGRSIVAAPRRFESSPGVPPGGGARRRA